MNYRKNLLVTPKRVRISNCKRAGVRVIELLLYLFQIQVCFSLYTIAITKTRLYNFDPLKPHFYTVKLGFTGVYNILLISAQNIDCGYSLEPPRRGGSNEYQQSMF